MLTIVCVSDTHANHWQTVVPDGDVLLYAGDMTRRGDLEDVHDFNRWLGKLPHRHKVVICGNHDFCFEREPDLARPLITNATYIQDETVVVEGIRIYGSPWQPWFFNWAFNAHRGNPIAEKWAKIPTDTDILITHGPVRKVLDMTCTGQHVGCDDLLARIREVKPRLHVCGHIHEAGGVERHGETLSVNASTMSGVGRGVVLHWTEHGVTHVE